MSHDDRARDVLAGVSPDWSRCHWSTHPLFHALLHAPDAASMEESLLDPSTNRSDQEWMVRALFAQVDHEGMRPLLGRLLDHGNVPFDAMVIWPSEKLRASFLREEIRRPRDETDLLPLLADRMSWLWEEDAKQLGMGEAHPVSKLVRFDREDILEPLFSSIPPSSWLDWKSPAASRMVSLLLRKARASTLLSLIRYDRSFLSWEQKKDGGSLLHKACAKLRPEIVALLLGEGMSASSVTFNNMTPAHVALASAIQKTNPRHKSSGKSAELMDRLREILHMLGCVGGLEGQADALLEELSSDRLVRMRIVVQHALMSSSSPISTATGDFRRL